MDEQRDFKGVWIPMEIYLNRRLTLLEKYYSSLFAQYGERKADELMLFCCSERSRTSIKNSLIERGLIRVDRFSDPYKAKAFAIANSNSGDICEWCGKEAFVLHEHHFPIQKKDGGTETVRICPNCHSTYHFVMEGK